MAIKGFTGTQKQYLEGLASGLRLAQKNTRSAPVDVRSASEAPALPPSNPDQGTWDAQDRFLGAGQRLSPEENAKRRHAPEDVWARITRRARERSFPEGDEVFLYKFHGLFYVSPVEEAFMCRLRFAGGLLHAHQLRGLADLAERYGHPLLQLTTRSNLQLRGIKPEATLDVLHGLLDLGIFSRGTGGDGVRNVGANPTAGFDRRELIDTAPLAREAHHRILSSRALWALPRKFTVAFDGGGAVGAFPETCDLGFRAVTLAPGAAEPAGVYFRLLVGGATSHHRYGRDAGLLVLPERCLDVFEQVLHIYSEYGDRTNRRRARLVYLVESWGMPRFVAELQARLRRSWAVASDADPLPLVSLDACQLPAPPDAFGHIGFHNQKPRGQSYVGVVLPLGQLTLVQARGLAQIADEFGSGELRLTPHQNVLVPALRDTQLYAVKAALTKLSLGWSASPFRSGLVACTGSTGCQFAEGDTKSRGEELVRHLESQIKFEQPLSIHISGCHHACAQHAVADIGLLAMRAPVGTGAAEHYQLWLGGRVAEDASFGHEYASNVPAADVSRVVQEVVDVYLKRRRPDETFRQFVGRVPAPDLQRWTRERQLNGAGGLR